MSYPKISIVTPSFNQGRFLEQTIKSILDQNYPNLEYIIIDGGSSDNSVQLIKKYEDRLAYWVSEPDHGQAHAINKGIEHCTGEIFNWINSDDILLPGSIETVARSFMNNPCLEWFLGAIDLVGEQGEGEFLSHQQPYMDEDRAHWLGHYGKYYLFCQQASFMRLPVFNKFGMLDETLHYCFDHEFYLRLLFGGIRPAICRETLGLFRIHPNAKTGGNCGEFRHQDHKVAIRYWDHLTPEERRKVKRILRKRLELDAAEESYALLYHRRRFNAFFHLLLALMQQPKMVLARRNLGALIRIGVFGRLPSWYRQ